MTRSPRPQNRIITLEKESIELRYEVVPLDDVKLDPDNPRIREQLAQRGITKKPTQDDLRKLLENLSGVADLQKHIRDNGGLHEPVVVLADGRLVEGNCRTAVLMRLRDTKGGRERWNSIPVYRLPGSITPRQIAVLQGQYHVPGKITWRKLEQAGHVYRMRTALGMEEGEISMALGLQLRVVKHLLQAYDLVTKQIMSRVKTGNGIDKFSHAYEFFKRKDLEDFRDDPKNIALAAKLIAEEKLKNGADVRNLKKISEDKDA